MPLVAGWWTPSRRVAQLLVQCIQRAEADCRRDRIDMDPELLRARHELLAFVKHGGTTSGTSAVPSTRIAEPPPRSASAPWATIGTSNAANSLGVSESMVRRLCRNGRLAAVRERGSWQIDPVSLDARRQQKDRQL